MNVERLMAQLGTACGCIERCMMILPAASNWHQGDAVLAVAVALDDASEEVTVE